MFQGTINITKRIYTDTLYSYIESDRRFTTQKCYIESDDKEWKVYPVVISKSTDDNKGGLNDVYNHFGITIHTDSVIRSASLRNSMTDFFRQNNYYILNHQDVNLFVSQQQLRDSFDDNSIMIVKNKNSKNK